MQQQTRNGYLLAVSSALVWAATSPSIKYLLDTQHVPALAIAFWRDALMAFACIAVLFVVRRDLLRVKRRDLRGLALAGAISIGVYHALWVFSIALNGAAVAVVLIYTFPTFVTLGAWIIFHERIRWLQVAALILSLLGCVLLVRAYDPSIVRLNGIGILVGLGCGLTHAGYVLFSQRAVETKSPWTSLAYTTLFGSLALLLLWIIHMVSSSSSFQLATIVQAVGGRTQWLVLIALALGPTLGGYALFTLALRYVPGRLASLVAVLEAPVSALISVVWLGERLEWPQVVGMLLILGAVGLPSLLISEEHSLGRDTVPVAAEG